MGKDGRPRGQGSILFANEEDAESAVSKISFYLYSLTAEMFDNTKFQDRVINVRLWKF